MPTGKNQEVVRAQLLLAGAKKHFTNTSTLTFASATHTLAEVESALQTLIDLRANVDQAKAVLQAKIATEAAQAPTPRHLMMAFATFVKATYSNSPDVLADFGLKPKKAVTPLTVEQKAEAAARRKATRAARHTLGSQQKKKVKGTVTTIVAATDSSAAHPSAPSPVASAPTPGASAGAAPHGS